jgi:hypothetical protein
VGHFWRVTPHAYLSSLPDTAIPEAMSLSLEENAARNRIAFFFGRPVAFHRCFVKLTGSVRAALMLSQALYWLNPERQGQKRGKDDGWFWKTREEWEAELGLSRWEQETARRQLRSTTFWREKQKRLEHRIYFGIDFVALEKALEAGAGSQIVEVSSPLPGGGDPTSGGSGITSVDGRGIPTPDGGVVPPSAKAEEHPSTRGKSRHGGRDKGSVVRNIDYFRDYQRLRRRRSLVPAFTA